MTALSLCLLIFCILFFILTRQTYVYIFYDERLTLEFHLVIFSLVLRERKEEKNGEKPSVGFYFSLLKRISSLSEKSFISINKIYISKIQGHLAPKNIFVCYLYQSVISGFIAYFFGKARRLRLEDNAVTLIPDANDSNIVDIRVYSEFYNILSALLKILFDFYKFRKKGRKKHVGN